MSAATLRFRIEAGALVRGDAMREIRSYCWDHHLDVHIDESRGWLESTLFCSVEGDEERLRDLEALVKRWAP